jgi:DNA polymerase-3 subunit gamma/tau
MSYVCLFRKYRPQRFEDVVGQTHVSQTLQNAVRLNRISQAYLFCGPRGVGKTTLARILAKALNCEQGPTPTPCGECEMCRRISAGQAVDIIEIDAASNRGIDDIRSLRDDVVYSPTQGRYKLYILDEAHQVTHDAFNAFLKTLEEPPAHALFVLATTEPHRIPATILSRCQRFDFKRVSIEEIVHRLSVVAEAEGLTMEEPAEVAVARAAEGSMRDALSILDQIVAYSGTQITLADVEAVLGTLEIDVLFEWGDFVAASDTAGGLRLINRLIDEGKDARQLVAEAMQHFRNLLLARLQCAPEQLTSLAPAVQQRLAAQAGQFAPDQLLGIIETLARADRELRWNPQPRLVLEVVLIELTHDELQGWTPPGTAAPLPSIPRPSRPLPTAPAAAPLTAAREVAPPPPVAGPSREVPPAATESLMEPESRPETAPPLAEPAPAEADTAPFGPSLPEVEPPAAAEAAPPPPSSDLAASPAPGPAREGGDLASFQSYWPTFLGQVKERRISTWTLIMDTTPLSLDGAGLTVGFQPEHPFRLAQAEQPKHRDLVEEMLSEFAGRTVRVRYEMMKANPVAHSNPTTPAPAPAPLTVDQIVDLFPGSRVVERTDA